MASVHDGHRERLRADYTQRGADSLPDHRFLELLLTYAIPRRDTNELAHALLERFGSLEAVFNAEIPQLMLIDGIGQSAAVFLCMQGDLFRRISARWLEDESGRTQIKNPKLAAQFALARLSGRAYENVELVCLNAKRYVQHVEPLQRGAVAEATVYPRHAAEAALLHRAHAVMLLHNHPSGSPAPSDADVETTDAIRAALAAVDIPLLDHIIVGTGCVYSFSADAILEIRGDDVSTVTVEAFEQRSKQSAAPLRKVYHRCVFDTKGYGCQGEKSQ